MIDRFAIVRESEALAEWLRHGRFADAMFRVGSRRSHIEVHCAGYAIVTVTTMAKGRSRDKAENPAGEEVDNKYFSLQA